LTRGGCGGGDCHGPQADDFKPPRQRLQVKLIGRLGGDEFHRPPLHRFGDRLRVTESTIGAGMTAAARDAHSSARHVTAAAG